MPLPTWGKLSGGITFDENKSPLDMVGLQGVFGKGNQPTPALRNRCRCCEGFSSLRPLRRRRFSEGSL